MAVVTAYYRTPPDGVRASGLAVTGVGAIAGQDRAVTRRVPTGYAAVFVTAGTGHLILHDRPGRHAVTPGTLFWLPPGIAHTYGPDGGAWDERWVLFDGPAAARYEDLGCLGAAPAVVEPEDPPGVAAAFDRLQDVAVHATTLRDHIALSAAAHTLIAAVGPGGGRATSARRDPVLDLGRRAVALLTADPSAPPRVAEVARALAVSHDTLVAAVRRLTGTTPADYLTRHRLDRAKSLLADTDLPVGSIARRVGYPDPAYFARVFSRNVGMAPSAFRISRKAVGSAP